MLGKYNGACVLYEKKLGEKCTGIGCMHHVYERLDDAAMRKVHGPTTSPEEGIARKFKEWMNNDEIKTADNVRC